MKKDRYLKLREEFLVQYEQLPKNEFGFVNLSDFKIRGFDKFILLFSLDYKGVTFNSIVKSIGIKQYKIHNSRFVYKIKINNNHSFLDKFPESYEQWIRYYLVC